MLPQFYVNGQNLDSLDLKVMLIAAGIVFPQEVYQHFSATRRVTDPSNLMACNCLILPGNVAAHLTPNDESPFSLAISDDDRPALLYNDQFVSEVEFPPYTTFFEQTTSSGKPFSLYSVLERNGIVVFHYLWPCQFARCGEPCDFCFQALTDVAGLDLPSPSTQEVGEIIAWGVKDGCVIDVQAHRRFKICPGGGVP